MPNINSKLDQLDPKALQDLLWKVKQTVAEGFSSPHIKVSIQWDPNLVGYRLGLPYNKEFVAALKTAIPDNQRGYDKTSETWTILEPSFMKALRVVLTYYVDTSIAKIQTRNEYEALLAASQVAAPAISKEQNAAYHFIANLDLDSLAAAFKKRAMSLHPDKGGSPSDFSDFNAAYQVLKEAMK